LTATSMAATLTVLLRRDDRRHRCLRDHGIGSNGELRPDGNLYVVVELTSPVHGATAFIASSRAVVPQPS
jgi:hypothetical protein